MATARDRLKDLYDRYDKDPVFDYLREDDINFVPGTGVLNPTAMLIGEAPGVMENARSIPFVGPAGKKLNELLFKVNIDISDLFLTNVLKYIPRTSERKIRTPTEDEIELSKSYVLEEIDVVNPSFVGLCGRIPTKVILPNITSLRMVNGQLINKKYVPLYHPAVVLYKPEKTQEVLAGYRVLASLIQTLED